MKNIFKFFWLFMFCGISGASASVPPDAFYGMPSYLADAARAWSGVFSDMGPSGEISAYINDVQASDIAKYLDVISVLGFNNTTMAIFETNHHIDRAFDVIGLPLVSRRNGCAQNLSDCISRRTFVLDGHIFGAFSDYDSRENGDFKTQNTGFTVNAKGFVSDGWLFGVEYTRSMTDTHDTRAYSDATSNSITMFSQYLSRSGMFINSGLNAGHTSWTTDKSISKIADDGAYDTDFYSAQINTGIRLQRGAVSITPQTIARYTYMSADKYADAAVQTFEDWWFNMLNVSAAVDMGVNFVGTDFVVRPSVQIGGGYDLISHGTDSMRVRLINGGVYYIPIDTPHRTSLNGELGINFYTAHMVAGLNYRIDVRSDYMSHTINATLKIGF